MSVAIAVTVTFPNATAAIVAATGTDIAQMVGPEVTRLVKAQLSGSDAQLALPTVAASVT